MSELLDLVPDFELLFAVHRMLNEIVDLHLFLADAAIVDEFFQVFLHVPDNLPLAVVDFQQLMATAPDLIVKALDNLLEESDVLIIQKIYPILQQLLSLAKVFCLKTFCLN